MNDLSQFDLTGRRALVTGASRGIGQTIAKALATAGADVAITARSEQALQETSDCIQVLGRSAFPFALDVTDVKAIDRTLAEAVKCLGGLDVLVNNAGVEEVRPSLRVDEALWDRIIDTNLKGAFFCARAAAQSIADVKGSGVIINLCSLTSHVGIPTAVPYGSSKSGLLGMTRALAAEWAPLGIRVNAIAPGYFRTAMTDVFYENTLWQEAMLGKIPLNRFGDLSDLEGTAVFLASDASRYITGQCIAVDGGYLASV
ncbi:SDR family NAD(P)-dependent oxidoreductase [Phyllobacterium endophyticum]|uniref:SDR family NAD(P)-dependent oxidoreductase n=1 Tax=Phyllobacterium endophyticum TaxID=1149773 RepID=UPI0011CC457A|nr:glucose 1-dehydrogenase [Phyllobacterium endophyticum]TXR49486.1 glucose 1-dehydrogenase [Phyllobacterium endophyticum]